MTIPSGWYKDPAEPTTQRYWDGEGWLGDPLPVDATPPPGPPPPKSTEPPAPVSPQSPAGGLWPATAAPPGTEPAPAHRPHPIGPGGPGGPGGPPAPGSPAGPPAASGPTAPPPGLPPLPPGYRWVRSAAPPRPHGYPVARPALRLAARAIDIGVLLLLNAAVNGWFAYRWWLDFWPYYTEVMRRLQANQSAADVPAPQSGALQIAIIIIGAALWFAYEVPALANSGQTPGKRLVGIRVLRVEEDGPLGFSRAIRRWNPMGLSMVLWLCCFVGFVFQFIDCLFVLIDRPLHQALHDKSAGTVVVKTGRLPLRHRQPTDHQPSDHQSSDHQSSDHHPKGDAG